MAETIEELKGNIGKKGYIPKATLYGSIKFRSRMEAKWACVFDVLGIIYEYEHHLLKLDPSYLRKDERSPDLYKYLRMDQYLYYLPDFYLPGLNLFVEIKGQEPTYIEETKALLTSIRCPVVMLCGGIPDIPRLLNEEDLDEQSYVYRTVDNKRLKYFNMYLCSCTCCGNISFYHTCSCDTEGYDIDCCVDYTSDDVINAYRTAYFYPYEDVEGLLPYPNLVSELITVKNQ